MAKTNEAKALKKNKSQFNIIGKIKITDKTFNLNNKYNSGWTDNSMYVNCGRECSRNVITTSSKEGSSVSTNRNWEET